MVQGREPVRNLLLLSCRLRLYTGVVDRHDYVMAWEAGALGCRKRVDELAGWCEDMLTRCLEVGMDRILGSADLGDGRGRGGEGRSGVLGS